MKKERKEAYAVVTESILKALDNGEVPWRKPWGLAIGQVPRNAISNRAYTGLNPLVLGMTGFSDPRWLTYKQAQEAGGQVRAGQRGIPVVFWKRWEVVDKDKGLDEDGNQIMKKIWLLKYYIVFNVAQVDDLTLAPIEDTGTPIEPITAAEQAIEAMPNPPSIFHDQANSAWYRPSTDEIHINPKTSFASPEGYYSTIFHELGHSTGHPSRLARRDMDTVRPFGSQDYGKEELVAEFTAAYLCHMTGVPNEVPQNAAYIKNWSKVIRDDPMMMITAAGQGQKAAEHILGQE